MSAFDEGKLGTAEFGSNYKQNYNKFGGAGGSYLGSFQMGRGAWTDSGGSGSDWDKARAQYRATGSQSIISFDEQRNRAEKYWTLCGAEYLGWNLGKGNMAILVANPGKYISTLGLCNVVKGQAYARGINCGTVRAAEVIARCEAYYNAGKSDSWTGNNPDGSTWTSPGVDKSIGADGTFGGVIKLYLVQNRILSPWTTKNTGNINNFFKVDCCIGLSGEDTFVTKDGFTGTIDYDYEISLPFVQCGGDKAYFLPISRG